LKTIEADDQAALKIRKRKPPNRKCQTCGKLFRVRPSRIKTGKGKYCSAKCGYVGAGKIRSELNKEKAVMVECPICFKLFRVKPFHKNRYVINYCSIKCRAKGLSQRFSGALSPSYKDGRSSKPGYQSSLNAQKRKNNPQFRLRLNFGRRMRKAIQKKKDGQSWEMLVGYTLNDLIKHIQKQFEPGMAWENYGKWHIDHIIPDLVFNYTKPEHRDFKRCWALKNLQPLWAADNLSKGAKLSKPFQPSLLV